MYLKKQPIDFLSAENLESLENSDGAIFLIKKNEEKRVLVDKQNKILTEIAKYRMLEKVKQGEILSLKEDDILRRLFNRRSIKKQIAVLEQEIQEINKIIKEKTASANENSRLIISIDEEILNFKKIIKKHGVNSRDVINKYNEIKSLLLKEESEKGQPQM